MEIAYIKIKIKNKWKKEWTWENRKGTSESKRNLFFSSLSNENLNLETVKTSAKLITLFKVCIYISPDYIL